MAATKNKREPSPSSDGASSRRSCRREGDRAPLYSESLPNTAALSPQRLVRDDAAGEIRRLVMDVLVEMRDSLPNGSGGGGGTTPTSCSSSSSSLSSPPDSAGHRVERRGDSPALPACAALPLSTSDLISQLQGHEYWLYERSDGEAAFLYADKRGAWLIHARDFLPRPVPGWDAFGAYCRRNDGRTGAAGGSGGGSGSENLTGISGGGGGSLLFAGELCDRVTRAPPAMSALTAASLPWGLDDSKSHANVHSRDNNRGGGSSGDNDRGGGGSRGVHAGPFEERQFVIVDVLMADGDRKVGEQRRIKRHAVATQVLAAVAAPHPTRACWPTVLLKKYVKPCDLEYMFSKIKKRNADYLYDGGVHGTNRNTGIVFVPDADNYMCERIAQLEWRWPAYREILFVVRRKSTRGYGKVAANSVDLFASVPGGGSLQLVRTASLESDEFEALARHGAWPPNKAGRGRYGAEHGARDVMARCLYDAGRGKWCVRCYEPDHTTPDTVQTVMRVLESVVDDISPQTMTEALNKGTH